MSNAGDRAVREKLAYLAQFRDALGTTIGNKDLSLLWPIRVLVFKNAKDMPAGSNRIRLGRNAMMLSAIEAAPFPREDLEDVARLLLERNTAGLPASVEKGLIALFSTLEVEGTHIT